MEQETQIYFLRHGQTNNNKEGRMQGRVDIPLNEVGRAQARCAAQRLKGIGFDAVYSSPLSRAVETAQIVTGLPVQVAERPLRRMWDDFLGNCGCVAVGVQGSAMRVLRVFPAVQMPQE